MADISASGGAGSGGTHLLWTLVFDDDANTVTVNAVHATFAGADTPDPQTAAIELQLENGQQIVLDLLTGVVTPGGGLFDGTPGSMLNTGDRVRTGVRLRVSAGRAAALAFSTSYEPAT